MNACMIKCQAWLLMMISVTNIINIKLDWYNLIIDIIHYCCLPTTVTITGGVVTGSYASSTLIAVHT